MGEVSDISWTDATHNEWIGCTKVSPGCANCYAETLMDTRYGRVKWGKGQARALTSEANRRKPLAWDRAAAKAGKRRRVFSASLSDWLDDEVDPAWLAGLLATVARTPNLDWLMLSKRPHLWRERLDAAADARTGVDAPGAQFIERWLAGDAPSNVWVGTTVEDQRRADERVPQLLSIPARVRFLSMEPLLGAVNLKPDWLYDLPTSMSWGPSGGPSIARMRGIHWLIIGGESGHGARPMQPAWARSLRDQAQAAGIAYHLKQWGEWAPAADQDIDLLARTPAASPNYLSLPGGGMLRVGKKAAGRLLDGREWNEFPEVRCGT